ncbi:peptidase [Mycena olivaceomarginata]|nr:peptidase [Mycena olivaceomarginata]
MLFRVAASATWLSFLTIATHASGRFSKHTAQFHFESDISDDQFENHYNEPGFELNLDDIRLVQFSLDEDAIWITERQKLHAKAMGKKYLDITDAPSNFGLLFEKPHFSYPPPNSSLVAPMLPLLSIEEMKINWNTSLPFELGIITASPAGRVQNGCSRKFETILRNSRLRSRRTLISVEPFYHKWKQASVENPFLPAPGADDDGSGTVTILEAYRALLKSKYIPTTPLEFHFYSAEEGGGLGSQDIVAAYEAEGKVVKGMQQYDMTAWVASGSEETVNIITNGVDAELTQFLTLLVDRYLDIPWVKETTPAGIGSDHLLWNRAGYQACHAFESLVAYGNNDNIHTHRDRIDASHEFSFSHMHQFAKLAVAFAVELSS